jgi:hypothetical protein
VANPNVADLQAVQGTAADDIWAVGQNGTVLHWDGRSLRATESGSKVMLSDVWPRARDDAWAVGLDGATLHWDGHAWRRVPSTMASDGRAIRAPRRASWFGHGSPRPTKAGP